jgi:hypothetical protein
MFMTMTLSRTNDYHEPRLSRTRIVTDQGLSQSNGGSRDSAAGIKDEQSRKMSSLATLNSNLGHEKREVNHDIAPVCCSDIGCHGLRAGEFDGGRRAP